jgi:hypothetical protein
VKRIKDDFGGSRESWANELIIRIKEVDPMYKAEWVRGLDLLPYDMAVGFARESNAVDCASVVWPDFLKDQAADLSEEYYKGGFPIAEELVAIAGYRLGMLLNMILA